MKYTYYAFLGLILSLMLVNGVLAENNTNNICTKWVGVRELGNGTVLSVDLIFSQDNTLEWIERTYMNWGSYDANNHNNESTKGGHYKSIEVHIWKQGETRLAPQGVVIEDESITLMERKGSAMEFRMREHKTAILLEPKCEKAP